MVADTEDVVLTLQDIVEELKELNKSIRRNNEILSNMFGAFTDEFTNQIASLDQTIRNK